MTFSSIPESLAKKNQGFCGKQFRFKADITGIFKKKNQNMISALVLTIMARYSVILFRDIRISPRSF